MCSSCYDVVAGDAPFKLHKDTDEMTMRLLTLSQATFAVDHVLNLFFVFIFQRN